MSESANDPSPRNSWTSLFQQTSEAFFLLSPRRRIRYVNRAFETLTRANAEQVVHEYCHLRKTQKNMPATRRSLLQTLAPPKEVLEGRVTRVRRPVPPAKLGPPWWDILFVPLREGEKLLAILGAIEPIGQVASSHGTKIMPESLIALRQHVVERYSLAKFAGEDPVTRRIYSQAQLASKTCAPVWIVGELGTGKETLARAIHYHGVTRELAFAAIDCAGLQPYLLRSLLSGHNGLIESGRVGTLYLKSPEALTDDLQQEMIEWGELLEDECRIVVGTTQASTFSPEFRAAFGIVEIHLPTLVERKHELPAIITNRGVSSISPDALTLLTHYTWPGNLGELRDVLFSAQRHANGGRIEILNLPLALRQSASFNKAATSVPVAQPFAKLDDVLEQVERRLIELALRRTSGDQTAAADLLGVYRSRLFRRIKALDLESHTQ